METDEDRFSKESEEHDARTEKRGRRGVSKRNRELVHTNKTKSDFKCDFGDHTIIFVFVDSKRKPKKLVQRPQKQTAELCCFVVVLMLFIIPVIILVTLNH